MFGCTTRILRFTHNFTHYILKKRDTVPFTSRFTNFDQLLFISSKGPLVRYYSGKSQTDGKFFGDKDARTHGNRVKHGTILHIRNKFARDNTFSESKANDSVYYGLLSLPFFVIAVAFAIVPLYDYFCQQYGYFGYAKRVKTYSPPPEDLSIKKFEIDFVTYSHVGWEFTPAQKKVFVRPGETTLVFYTAKNLQKVPIIGIAAYRVLPDEAGLYFNKIQCFCFDEQMLNPGEEVDLPVLFFLDPKILEDHRLDGVEKITLSYIFFETDSEIPPEYKTLFERSGEESKNSLVSH
ncbi:cytochrome C oxidase assembly protein cox11, putative [Theileria equi strain WA]|uniref:Cytochrome C oxidase assembly protein cox11, putative n=1 Tax=Theileria equi strain WA TaxID=1537102 RepID=L0AY77_THEEQ|nr:cytochrome C oxidase assembly protein cox11, putative [Theileria equi strain WA]AFZ80515.1 cytochrome C oxidase assembly protein cox11, putative [Theileria equi strain WA]|eukprot:XP_004830181.1 cytochrome C oxidase assembly protein cox11, putative [Theileria equi strain WA]